MAQLIKLESGQYLNLDYFIITGKDDDGSIYGLLVGGSTVGLSDKDLQEISGVAGE